MMLVAASAMAVVGHFAKLADCGLATVYLI